MSKFLLMALTFSFAFNPLAQASVEVFSTDNYANIHRDIMELGEKANTDEILLAFDIDDTLLIVQDCLKPKDTSTWFTLALNCSAELTEKRVEEDLREFQGEGFATLALTARSEILIPVTERELARNDLEFYGSPFKAKDNFEVPFTKRSKIIFKEGVAYSSGKNKGEVLKILLAKLPRSFDQVVFVDDGVKNIKDMTKAFEHDPSVHVRIYHYTKYNKPKAIP